MPLNLQGLRPPNIIFGKLASPEGGRRGIKKLLSAALPPPLSSQYSQPFAVVHHLRSQLATHKAPLKRVSMAARKPQRTDQREGERVSTVHFTIDGRFNIRRYGLRSGWL